MLTTFQLFPRSLVITQPTYSVSSNQKDARRHDFMILATGGVEMVNFVAPFFAIQRNWLLPPARDLVI